MDELLSAWDSYKQYLVEKYPAKDGEEWDFTCQYHKHIDMLLSH
jgi:hypothetical protein